MDKFVALLVSGLAFGAIVALVAVGFLVVQKASGVINFAHGDLVTLGTFVAIWLIGDLGLPILLAYLLAMVLMFGAGVAIERVAFAPLSKREPLTVVIATLAASIVIQGGLAIWQGADAKPLPSPVAGRYVHIFGTRVTEQRILVIVVSAVVIGALMLVFQRTSFGRQLRALASDAEAARMFGLRTRRLTMIAFGLSAVLACLAGVLAAPMSNANISFGFKLMISGFAATVIGGFGSFRGVIVGAVGIGLVQQLLGGYFLINYSEALPFIVMFLVIVLKPEGLFGTTAERL